MQNEYNTENERAWDTHTERERESERSKIGDLLNYLRLLRLYAQSGKMFTFQLCFRRAEKQPTPNPMRENEENAICECEKSAYVIEITTAFKVNK